MLTLCPVRMRTQISDKIIAFGLYVYTYFKISDFKRTRQFLAYFPHFEKNKRRLMGAPCCLYVFVSPPHELLNASTSIFENWYAYHGN
jgi:hypothetical protein